MSENPKAGETPELSPAPAAPAAPTPDPGPQTPDPGPQTPDPQQAPAPLPGVVRPPIDYAMPAQKKSWLPTPAIIRNLGCLFKLIVGFTVLICMGYFALVALNPKARQWALQGSKPGPGGAPPSGKGPTPFKIVNQVLAIPAQALGKTDDVVKANNARVGQLDGVIKQEEAQAKGGTGSRTSRPVVDPFATPSAAGGASRPDKTSAADEDTGPQAVSAATMLALAEKRGATTPSSELPAPSSPKPQGPDPGPQTPTQMKLAGDIVIAQASPPGVPPATAPFFYAIVKLNVSGITQGQRGRALINGRLTYEGDEINRTLGIVFTQLDSANKLLIFRDATGAIVTRSY